MSVRKLTDNQVYVRTLIMSIFAFIVGTLLYDVSLGVIMAIASAPAMIYVGKNAKVDQ